MQRHGHAGKEHGPQREEGELHVAHPALLVLIERAADRITDLSFNELLRSAADAGLLNDPAAWRIWRELRNATSHAYDEIRAQQVAEDAARFCIDAQALLVAMEAAQ